MLACRVVPGFMMAYGMIAIVFMIMVMISDINEVITAYVSICSLKITNKI